MTRSQGRIPRPQAHRPVPASIATIEAGVRGGAGNSLLENTKAPTATWRWCPPLNLVADTEMIEVKTLRSWGELHRYREYGRHRWLFRGQRDAAWDLKTSIERCLDREQIPAASRQERERGLMREFRRAYHQYAAHVPPNDYFVEWLALMQHHGAPTRLLNFTYSIYVAAYFATEDTEGDCAVWAINGSWAFQQTYLLLKAANKPINSMKTLLPYQFDEGREKDTKELFFESPVSSLVCPINPYRLNERLRTQKGIFLMQGDLTSGFMANLTNMRGFDKRRNAIKLVIPKLLRREFLKSLFEMNINRTSLFPGLDGFARSLGVYSPAYHAAPWLEETASGVKICPKQG